MNRPKTLPTKWSVAATFAGLIALALFILGPLSGQFSRVLITGPIDETKLATLRGNTRPEAKDPRNDRGAVPDSFKLDHMLLQLKRSPVLESELVHYIDQLTDKSSANFRHWIAAQQIGEKYGPSQQDLDTIKSWLESKGFSVDGIQPNRMAMDISATAGQIRDAFHTEIHFLAVNGEARFANTSDPQIPEALVPAIVGVVSMHNFPAPRMSVPRGDFTFSGCGTTCYALVPADLQTIYNVTPAFRRGILGQGQTIVVVEDSDTYSTDVATYRSAFLSKYSGTTTLVHPSGSNACTDPGANAGDSEADIDAEVAGAIAPDATIEVATCADTTTTGVLLAIQNLVNASTPPSIISMSYGECEAFSGATENASFNSAFQTGAAGGVSIFASSGDAGSSACANLFGSTVHWAYPGAGITGWGESIYNVSVGGTDFEDLYNADKGGLPQSTYWSSANTGVDGSAKSYIPEIPWNNSCAGYLISNLEGYTAPYGSSGFCNSTTATTNNTFLSFTAAGGGPSTCATGGGGTDQTGSALVDGTCAGYAKPSWQSGIFGNPSDGVRDIPDVSLFASNGFWGHYVTICWSDTTNGGLSCSGTPSTWSGFGGTSISAPVMAAMQSLVNQKWGLTKVGNPNPTYYAIANSEFGASGNTACYSNNLPARRGIAPNCVFNDITQGDIDVNCRTDGQVQANCYIPSGTNGVLSSQAISSVTVTAGGSGYSAASCTIAPPQNQSAYLSPTGSTLYLGTTTAATCTPQFGTPATGTISITGTPATSWAGVTVTVAGTTYTFATSLTAANQVLLYTSGSSSTTKQDVTAANLAAAIAGNSVSCGSVPPCFGTGTVANTKVSVAPWDNNTTATSFTVTATTTGPSGNFTMTSSNTSDVTVSGGSNGAAGTNIGLITVNTGGSGYLGNAVCTITGNGTGASCIANALPQYASGSYQPTYGATPGWDFATGLGSVNATNLIYNGAW